MTSIAAEVHGSRLYVTSPYHPSFPAAARDLGGRFDRDTKAWIFDARDETRVRELLVATFGTDGTAQGETLTVRVDLDARYGTKGFYKDEGKSLYIGGREVAHRPGRDAKVRLGSSVVVTSGAFTAYGGSAHYPMVAWERGTVVEVRDLPAKAAEAELERDGVTLVDANIDRSTLEAERERLVKRLAEIDQLLTQ